MEEGKREDVGMKDRRERRKNIKNKSVEDKKQGRKENKG